MAALDLYEQFLAAPEDGQANRDGVSWINYKLHADALAAELRALRKDYRHTLTCITFGCPRCLEMREAVR